MAGQLFFKVVEVLCKQDVEKLKLFAATLGIDGEQIKTSEGRRDLKYIIIKVLEGKLDEEGKTDQEKSDIFKHIIKFYNGDQGKVIMMVKVIIFHSTCAEFED